MKKKICGIYKIKNKLTEEFYIGSSVDVMKRWRDHKEPSTHKRCSNNRLYQDIDKYGVDSFDFEILEEVEPNELRIKEQEYIKRLNPTYNDRSAFLSVEDRRAYIKAYEKSEKRETYNKARRQNEEYKAYHNAYSKDYDKSEKRKSYHRTYNKFHRNQLCNYNGENITFGALAMRFQRQGISQPTTEAKKYLIAS